MSISIVDDKNRLKTDNKYPGLSVLHFRFLFKKIEEVLHLLDYPTFLSPYSIVPFISQAIGLDIPTMGSGKSPYSIVSYFTKLHKNIFLDKNKALTYQERRNLIDELYDMIAPYLLGEEEEYINLLIKTKLKKSLLVFDESGVEDYRKIMRMKFDILKKFLNKVKFTGGDYAHLAHYGYIDDLCREQGFIEGFDEDAKKLWLSSSYPVVLEMQIDGFKAKNETICGWYILVPNYTEELIRSKALRQKKLLQAGLLAKKLGAKFSGMAGLMASFSKGGKFLSDNIKDFGFTTGHSFTIANIYEIAKNIINKVNLDLSKSKFAIIGAAGSIGSGVAKLISEKDIEEIILIDMPNMVSASKLKSLRIALKQINPKNNVTVSKSIDEAKRADILIVATNASSAFIESQHLKEGAIIIDDSFPKNVSRKLVKERDDIILLEGGVCQFPKRQSGYVARNIPDLLDLSVSKLVSCKQAYGCLSESFILAAYGHKGNYGLGDSDPVLAKDIWEKGKKLGVRNAAFQNYGIAVEEERINRVKKIIKNRNN